MLSELNKKQNKDNEINNRIKKQFVVFLVGKEEFGVNIKQTREIINATELTYIPDAPDFVKGVINLRGKIVPIIDLQKRLSLTDGKTQNCEEKIIIIELNQTLIGFIVKDVKEIIRINEDNIGKPPQITKKVNKDYIAGVGKLENRLLILLNMDRILTTEEIEAIEDIKV